MIRVEAGATHILAAGHALTGFLLDRVDNLAVPAMAGKYAAELPPHDSPADLAAALRSDVGRARVDSASDTGQETCATPLFRIVGRKHLCSGGKRNGQLP